MTDKDAGFRQHDAGVVARSVGLDEHGIGFSKPCNLLWKRQNVKIGLRRCQVPRMTFRDCRTYTGGLTHHSDATSRERKYD